jgi:hypothetical protein
MTLRFPQLRSLTLENFAIEANEDSLSQSVTFWRAHPLLQYLKLPYPPLRSRWFNKLDVDPEILPNLKYLQVIISLLYII